ncbi:hypothetical protein JNB88_10290 [Rhizobium cauense]|uniref:hypothetical protein n=1 Tax=Rhizobium cauense TaxID=1166683 RepID=UPI001C6DD5D3|nr:hypothetical protein [Rhizobium cauense]MBW9114026.1 hypothetical protein [Rhizobium cauense]
MSIDGRSSTAAATIHINHWCLTEGCRAWGGFGHARSKYAATEWWSWEHYPHKPTVTEEEAGDIGDRHSNHAVLSDI